jgi:hypothetical protein
MIRGRCFRALALTAVALLALVGAEAARAGGATVSDGNDTRGRLDIKSVSQGHSGAKITHTIRTFSRWPKSLLDEQHSNSFLMLINTDRDRVIERFVFIITTRGRLAAGVLTSNGNFLGRADVSRPDQRSVRVKISKSRLGNPPSYRWQGFSSFQGGGCHSGCVDRTRRLLHDLRAPRISFPQPPSPSAGLTYDLEFTVRDAGKSGLDVWRLQQRDQGADPWTTLAQGGSVGPRSVLFMAGATGDVDQFRVVAVDNHGNRTVSAVRSVTAGP